VSRRSLILSFTSIPRDPRVLRQLDFLKADWELTTCGLGKVNEIQGFVLDTATATLRRRWLTGWRVATNQHDIRYWEDPLVKRAKSLLAGKKYDLIIANDIETLPLALFLGDGCSAKVLFDSHEYAPKEWEDQWRWRLLHQRYKTYLFEKYVPLANGCLTVSPGIAAAISPFCQLEPEVITNSPAWHPLEPSAVDPDNIRLIWHGVANRSRQIEQMIKAVKLAGPMFSLDLILVPGDPKYIQHISNSINDCPTIRIVEPVITEEVPRFINQYDLGLYLLPPTSFNNRYALPNKIFEFIHARLGIIIGPSPDMADIVKTFDLGLVSPDFSIKSLTTAIQSLNLDSIERYKSNSCHAAEVLCAQRNQAKFTTYVNRVMEA
jgi:glycosyltransferase involved in cell wall biosynthesis